MSEPGAVATWFCAAKEEKPRFENTLPTSRVFALVSVIVFGYDDET